MNTEPGIFIPLWAIWYAVEFLIVAGAFWLGWALRGKHERDKLLPIDDEPEEPQLKPLADMKPVKAVRA